MCKYEQDNNDSDSSSSSSSSSSSGSSSINYNEDALRIRDEFGEDILNLYCRIHEEYVDIVVYDEFKDRYIGHFDTLKEFINHILKKKSIEIPQWIIIDYMSTWEILKRKVIESDNHYFWNE